MAKVKMPVEKLKASTKPEKTIAKESKEDEARERKWKAEDALRTMQRAEEIKRDPDLCNDMKALAKEQMAALKKVAK